MRMALGSLWVVSVAFGMGGAGAGEQGGWYVLTAEDRERIRGSAATDWGRDIVEHIKGNVEDRRAFPLSAPASEAGHFHHYFCPVHNSIFQLDIGSPRRHFCPHCDAHHEGRRYDLGWIMLYNSRNQQFMQHCMFLHIVTGEASYLEHIRDLLLDYARRYPAWEIHGHDMEPGAWYGGRMASQTLDEAVWASHVAPAFVEALPVMTDAQARTIRDHLLRPMAETIRRNQAGGNWQVWHNSGKAAIAIALRDEELLETALRAPGHGYDHMMAVGLTAEGWWEERSPGYHFYPLHAMLMTADAVRCRGMDLYDGRLMRMFRAPLHFVYADLAFPAHNDGWHGLSLVNQASLYAWAAMRFEDARLREVLARCITRELPRSVLSLHAGRDVEPDPSPLRLPSYLYPDTGVGFLRHGGRTVVLKFGPHGGGHGHPDKLSISIHDGVREILPDLGSSGYGSPDHGGWYVRSVAHNTVVVDQADQRPAAGKLVAFEARDDGGVIEASCDTAYDGVAMRRRLELKGPLLTDLFVCRAAGVRVFDYVLLLPEPLTPGPGAEPARLPVAAGYGRIEDARQWPMQGPVSFPVGGAVVTLTSEGETVLITGRAPGVPASAAITSSRLPCYPLLVRTRGECMRVTATWRFSD